MPEHVHCYDLLKLDKREQKYMSKSKETYGQARGLSNLEINMLVNQLAIIGTLLKAVKTGWARTMRGWLLLHAYYKNSQGSRTAAEHEVVKAKGSWVTLDTPAQNIGVLPSPHPTTTQKLMLILVCLLGKLACIQE